MKNLDRETAASQAFVHVGVDGSPHEFTYDQNVVSAALADDNQRVPPLMHVRRRRRWRGQDLQGIMREDDFARASDIDAIGRWNGLTWPIRHSRPC